MTKKYFLRYDRPFTDGLGGWVNHSLMLGNGYFGANIFGNSSMEQISFSEHTLEVRPTRYINERYSAGNECFAFLYIDFPHTDSEMTDFSRELCLNTGIAQTTYTFDGNRYLRECFTSYPDKVFVMHLAADKSASLNCTIRPRIAYKRAFLVSEGDGRGKTGTVTALDDQTIALEGISESFQMEFQLYMRVIPQGGTITAIQQRSGEASLQIRDADSAYLILSLGTNYDLDKIAFEIGTPRQPLKDCPSRREEYLKNVLCASQYSYEELKQRHLADFQAKFQRVSVDLGGQDDGRTTDALLRAYRNGEQLPYLEEMHFQFGRYLLLCSSREGGLPANLQGIWNMYDYAPWTCGYWYNINIQMNYWPAFVCNLADCFIPYHRFNQARFQVCSRLADAYIAKNHPDKYEEGKNGWIVGTANSPIRTGSVGGHSGPGTGGLTTKACWDYYDFTRDKELLALEIYPFLEAVTRFYVKCVEEIDGKMLVTHSSSPEQKVDDVVYVTTGCAFDQQMVYESNRDFLKASDILGLDSGLVDLALYNTVKEQIHRYDPVQIGVSGQIKEYREETAYGEIGEKEHRHISQLAGAYPGTLLGSENPAWSDAAKQTVKLRGYQVGKGWTKAHKMLVLARNGGVEEAVQMGHSVLCENVFDNLWNDHTGVAVFQADANFGLTAAYAELLIQSHEGFIHVLPRIPKKWSSGSFDGLCARGNFEVGATWTDGAVTQIRILSNAGGTCTVKCHGLAHATVTDAVGNALPTLHCANSCPSDSDEHNSNIHQAYDSKLSFETTKGEAYFICDITLRPACQPIQNLKALRCNHQVQLTWNHPDSNAIFTIYRAEDSSPNYSVLAHACTAYSYTDTTCAHRVTYKVTACTNSLSESEGSVVFV